MQPKLIPILPIIAIFIAVKTIVVLTLFMLVLSAEVKAQQASATSAESSLDSLLHLSSRRWTTDSLTILSWSDSLKIKINQKFTTDSLGLHHKIDSLQQLNLPTDKYTQKLDSIINKRNAMLHEVQSKQDNLLSGTKNKLEQWQNQVKSKLGLDSFSSNTGMDIPGANVPVAPNAIPGDALNNMQLPEMPVLSSNEFQGLDFSPDLSQLNQSLSFGQVEGLNEIQNKISSVNENFSNITAFTKDTDKAIESSVNQIDEVKEVKEQLKMADGVNQNKFLEKAEQLKNPDAMKEEVKQQAVQQAVNHFAGKEEVLKQAMEKMAKYKQKYSSLNSLSDIPKKKPNEMRGKPFVERLVPGIAFQIQRKNDLLIDFNPYIGYRLTGRLTSGIGWNQRVAFIKWNEYNPQNKIYGPRAYGEFKLWKGFSPRAEIEVMNAYVPPPFRTSINEGQREWVWSAMIGLKKEYRFLKQVKGTAFVMFNLFDPHNKSPYIDVVNTRFGFEFPIKKKSKHK